MEELSPRRAAQQVETRDILFNTISFRDAPWPFLDRWAFTLAAHRQRSITPVGSLLIDLK
jgi:hypothetical protein